MPPRRLRKRAVESDDDESQQQKQPTTTTTTVDERQQQQQQQESAVEIQAPTAKSSKRGAKAKKTAESSTTSAAVAAAVASSVGNDEEPATKTAKSGKKKRVAANDDDVDEEAVADATDAQPNDTKLDPRFRDTSPSASPSKLPAAFVTDDDERFLAAQAAKALLEKQQQESAALKPQGPTKRLIMREMLLENFKSYAGEQKIGPFHKVSICACCVDVCRFWIFNGSNCRRAASPVLFRRRWTEWKRQIERHRRTSVRFRSSIATAALQKGPGARNAAAVFSSDFQNFSQQIGVGVDTSKRRVSGPRLRSRHGDVCRNHRRRSSPGQLRGKTLTKCDEAKKLVVARRTSQTHLRFRNQIVADSEITVSRTARSSNESKYYLNGTACAFKVRRYKCCATF
jgi:hypothetical protein